MARIAAGLLSDLVLVRMQGRARRYVDASEGERRALVEACRREATVRDLAERILSRTIYGQAAHRAAAVRELVQNALDASPRGARIDVRTGEAGRELVVADAGRGMSRRELLDELLVPFRSSKEREIDAIGEHGIGFLAALELATSVEVTTVARAGGAHALRLIGAGQAPPFDDFAWELDELPGGGAPGTTVRIALAQPVDRAAIAAEVAAVAGFVDPSILRIYVNDALVNVARARARRVARVPIEGSPGDLELFIGRGEGIPPHVVLTQKGLSVAVRQDPFPGPDHALHRDLFRALAAAGYGVIAEVPACVPLNKGRSAVAA
ncbi:MAG TPA: ATP-binding protein, partial [Minicystis sp.]|nr:ATP-binding protein [Minicystis sp.]